MAGEDDLAGPMEELRSAWSRFTQTVSVAWDEAKSTLHFGENQMTRAQLARILYSSSKLATNAFNWESESERRRHSVQLRRLSVLAKNLDALALFVDGGSVEVSDGDILSILDPGEGEDTPEQRAAPRADSEEEKIILANVYQRLRALQSKAHHSPTKLISYVNEIDSILAYIRENN